MPLTSLVFFTIWASTETYFSGGFQEKDKGLDHWSIGASVCLERYRNAEIAMAIQGHHVGLQWWDREELGKFLPTELEKHIADGRRLTGGTTLYCWRG
jgi:CRISPR-associated endonuclease/helicase Cas3